MALPPARPRPNPASPQAPQQQSHGRHGSRRRRRRRRWQEEGPALAALQGCARQRGGAAGGAGRPLQGWQGGRGWAVAAGGGGAATLSCQQRCWHSHPAPSLPTNCCSRRCATCTATRTRWWTPRPPTLVSACGARRRLPCAPCRCAALRSSCCCCCRRRAQPHSRAVGLPLEQPPAGLPSHSIHIQPCRPACCAARNEYGNLNDAHDPKAR